MQIKKRLMLIRIIDKMNQDEAYSKKLGLENVSRFSSESSPKKERMEEG